MALNAQPYESAKVFLSLLLLLLLSIVKPVSHIRVVFPLKLVLFFFFLLLLLLLLLFPLPVPR